MIRTAAALFAALALVAAACTASDSTSTAPEGSAGFPITIDAPSGPATLDAQPTYVSTPRATHVAGLRARISRSVSSFATWLLLY